MHFILKMTLNCFENIPVVYYGKYFAIRSIININMEVVSANQISRVDIWRHLGHYPVDSYTSHWLPKGHGHEWLEFLLCNVNQPSLFMGQAYFKLDPENPWSMPYMWSKVLTLGIEGHSHGQGQTQWSHLGFCVRYVCFSVRGNRPFCLIYSKFRYWPWKFKVKVRPRSYSRPYLRPRVQSKWLLLISWQSDHI